MSYLSEISRNHPTAILLMLDQSASMSESFGGGNGSKAVEAARIVNRILTELTLKCAKADEVRDYFDIAVIGYGGSVGNAFGGALGLSTIHPISKVGESPTRLDTLKKKIPDGTGGLLEVEVDVPVWIDPMANGATPMCQAIGTVSDIVSGWVAGHPDSFPPTVINVTDGEANDGNPVPFAGNLVDLSTSDGNVLLFNCHISSSNAQAVRYPSSVEQLPSNNDYAVQLYEMSSVLPSKHLELAQSESLPVSSGSRGFVFNASVEDLILFIEIGTRIKALSAELS